MNTWHEDDAFWAENGPQMFTPKRLANTAKEIDGVLVLLSLPPGAAILDLPCGPGRHSIELATRGFHVTAV
ncbi:MAG: SAM-dependent methyltransferase, partial [Pyrinomonadaceae bacterium]|nr:SAM-dependent methyltransferase [Phycisphaerales bacterium]